MVIFKEWLLTEGKKRFYYHATLARNMENIANRMTLEPSEETNWGGELGASSTNKVYFGKDGATAEYYGDILARNIGDKGEFLAILKISLDKSDVVQDKKDKNSVYVTKPVSLEGAFVLDADKKWRPLTQDTANAIGSREWDDLDYEDEEEL